MVDAERYRCQVRTHPCQPGCEAYRLLRDMASACGTTRQHSEGETRFESVAILHPRRYRRSSENPASRTRIIALRKWKLHLRIRRYQRQAPTATQPMPGHSQVRLLSFADWLPGYFDGARVTTGNDSCRPSLPVSGGKLGRPGSGRASVRSGKRG